MNITDPQAFVKRYPSGLVFGLTKIEELERDIADYAHENAGLEARNDALEAIVKAAQALTVAISYVHTPERDYIDVPQAALNALNGALGVLDALDEEEQAPNPFDKQYKLRAFRTLLAACDAHASSDPISEQLFIAMEKARAILK